MTTETATDGTNTIELNDLVLPAEPSTKVTGGIATNQTADATSLTNV